MIAYSDILFDGEALAQLLKSERDITLLVDRSYQTKAYAKDAGS